MVQILKILKIDDIRKIKKIFHKKQLIDKRRFIILDDIDTFNINSLNALFKNY